MKKNKKLQEYVASLSDEQKEMIIFRATNPELLENHQKGVRAQLKALFALYSVIILFALFAFKILAAIS